mgnify:CR=1 FL=1
MLKQILGELKHESGKGRQGTKREVAYCDQRRSPLKLDARMADTISPGSEWVEFAGQRKHVMSYLNDFLFSPERANSPVRPLSGGARNHVLLARLLARPARPFPHRGAGYTDCMDRVPLEVCRGPCMEGPGRWTSS